MPEKKRKLDSTKIDQMIEIWRSQPGYSDPRIKDLIDGSVKKLHSLAEEGNKEALLKTVQSIKSQILQIYNHETPIPKDPQKKDPTEKTEIPETIKTSLEKDYQEQQEIFAFYDLIKPGETSYHSDYAETAGESYKMPTMEEIFNWLTADQIKLYKEMEKEGLEPKLQLTPIGLNIRTLASKIDGNKTMPNQTDTFISDKAIDATLKYAPTGYDASNPKKLITIGGKTKAEYIRENNGWLVDIVATKQNIEPDLDIQKDSAGKIRTIAEQISMHNKKMKNEGKTGLSNESYLTAQMRALKEGEPLEKDFWTILPDSSIDNEDFVSYAFCYDVQVSLSYCDANFRSDYLCCRSSVRVPRDL